MPGLLTYWHTLRYLRPVQIYGRVWHRLALRGADVSAAPGLRRPGGTWVRPVPRPASLVGPDRFCFHRRTHALSELTGWDDPRIDRLWRYHMHYFDDLNAAGAEERARWQRALLERWVDENPPGQGSGWEPYPASRRIVNWIKWSLQGGELTDALRHSLAVQARWLRSRLEYHLLGNHLLANAKALVFSGLYFEGPEAEAWYRTGMELLARELDEQVLADGGHFERSPMYHLIVLEDLLDLINLHRVYGVHEPDSWSDTAARMLAWARTMQHPDGEIPFFNDAAFGMAATPGQVEDYAGRLGLGFAAEADKAAGLHDLAESGYVRVEQGGLVALLDAAPVGPDYQPAHAHADTLGFELSLHGRRVLVNSGTSTYEQGPERARQRGTAAHNTLVIDGRDSSEVWASFRVARRARVIERRCEQSGDVIRVLGAHDGYRRWPGRPVHRRSWEFGEGRLVVTDEVEGDGRHDCELVYHFHPDVSVLGEGDRWRAVIDDEVLAGIVIEGPGDVSVEPATWHPEFGQAIENRKLVMRANGDLPLRWTTTFIYS